MSSIAIRKRILSAQEAALLYRTIKEVPNISGYTFGEWRNLGPIWIAEDGKELVGVCVNVRLPGNWEEIATLYVFPKYHGRGIGRKLFDRAFREAKRERRHIYIVSRNPKVIHMMRKKRMRFVFPLLLPLPLQWRNLVIALHPYRVYEYIRKLLHFGHKTRLVFGYKKHNQLY